jgi:hypothetical protein
VVVIKHRTGAVQVRMVMLIAIRVIVRKPMLLDYAAVEVRTLLGLAGAVARIDTWFSERNR